MKCFPILVCLLSLVLWTNSASLEKVEFKALEPDQKSRVKRQVCKDDPDCWDIIFPSGSTTRGVRPKYVDPCKDDPDCVYLSRLWRKNPCKDDPWCDDSLAWFSPPRRIGWRAGRVDPCKDDPWSDETP